MPQNAIILSGPAKVPVTAEAYWADLKSMPESEKDYAVISCGYFPKTPRASIWPGGVVCLRVSWFHRKTREAFSGYFDPKTGKCLHSLKKPGSKNSNYLAELVVDSISFSPARKQK